MSRIFIALGGNMGDVVAHFRAARTQIEQWDHTHHVQSSLLYQTPPLGPPGQPDYSNAMLAITSTRAPLDILDALQSIELQHGRVRAEHWGPRTLDLDLIAIGALIMASERLCLPHPQMQNRQFVLRPLCDLAPNWQHPQLGTTAAIMLDALLEAGEMPLPKGITW